MDLAALQTALKALVRAALGWTAGDLVAWAHEPWVLDPGRRALLAWVSLAAAGVDETRYEDSDAPSPALNLTPVTVGNRLLVLQVDLLTLAQDPAAPNAVALAERLRTRLRRPSALAALASANVGLVDAKVVTLADVKVDQAWRSRALLEVRLNATVFDRSDDPADATASIERVEVTSHVVDPGGGELAAPLQMNAEVIP